MGLCTTYDNRDQKPFCGYFKVLTSGWHTLNPTSCVYKQSIPPRYLWRVFTFQLIEHVEWNSKFCDRDDLDIPFK